MTGLRPSSTSHGAGRGGRASDFVLPQPAIVLVEEGALAPVARPAERSADLVRGFVTGLRPSSTSDCAGRGGRAGDFVLPQPATALVEEGALAPVTRPGERSADGARFRDGPRRPSSTSGRWSRKGGPWSSASLVEEGALAPVTRPGERSADLVRGFVTGLRPSSTSDRWSRKARGAFVLPQPATVLVEEGALAPVTRPGERSADLVRGFVTGLRPSSTSGLCWSRRARWRLRAFLNQRRRWSRRARWRLSRDPVRGPLTCCEVS